MPQTDNVARTRNYRALRSRAWVDLAQQHDEYVEYYQEHEGLGLGGEAIDESRFRGPVNLFLDELLTHSSQADAASLIRALPAGWGTTAEAVLYQPREQIIAFIERSLPERQWGQAPVEPAVTADPVKWEPWLRARLQLLGVPDGDVFTTPSTSPKGTAAPEAVSRWRVLVPLVGSVAVTVGVHVWLSRRAARRREVEAP